MPAAYRWQELGVRDHVEPIHQDRVHSHPAAFERLHPSRAVGEVGGLEMGGNGPVRRLIFLKAAAFAQVIGPIAPRVHDVAPDRAGAQHRHADAAAFQLDAQMLGQLGGMYAAAGKPDQALRLFNRAIGQEPQRSEHYFAKGLLLANQKHYDEAENTIRAGIKVSPDSAVEYYYLGRISVDELTCSCKFPVSR